MRRGFTLIELLVVIAIIAILAAILFPVFARAREKARQTSCLSNLKQIGLAYMMYNQDYDETTPPGGGWEDASGNEPGPAYWQYRIMPYVKNWNVFECPSDGRGDFNYHEQVLYYGYANHTHLAQAMARIKRPASTVLTGDGVHPAVEYPRGLAPGDCGAWRSIYDSGWCTNYDAPTEDDFNHNAGNNVAFWDGHAKWLSWQTLKSAMYYFDGQTSVPSEITF